MIEEDPEPESPESQYVDAFFDAIAAGKEVQAANALRSLESLDGYPLEFLADLLDDLPIYGQIFPHRLEWKKLSGRGRPKKKPDTSNLNCLELGCATAFFHGIAAGNAPEAAKALRTLKTLHGAQLKLLADLFDAKAVLPEGFYWRLKLVGRRAGTPVNRLNLKRVAKDFWERRVLTSALAAHPGGKKEAIIHEVMKRACKPRSTVIDMMKRHGIPAPRKI
jgi:hypothetical protein